jgi:hypothetical protein
MAFLYVVFGMIAGGTVAAFSMALLFLSKNADDNANTIFINMPLDGAKEELTEHSM